MLPLICSPWFQASFTLCCTVAKIWQAGFKLYKIYLECFAILCEKNVSYIGNVKFIEVLPQPLFIASPKLPRTLLQQTREITRNTVCRIYMVVPFFSIYCPMLINKLLHTLMTISYWFMTFVLLPFLPR